MSLLGNAYLGYSGLYVNTEAVKVMTSLMYVLRFQYHLTDKQVFIKDF